MNGHHIGPLFNWLSNQDAISAVHRATERFEWLLSQIAQSDDPAIQRRLRPDQRARYSDKAPEGASTDEGDTTLEVAWQMVLEEQLRVLQDRLAWLDERISALSLQIAELDDELRDSEQRVEAIDDAMARLRRGEAIPPEHEAWTILQGMGIDPHSADVDEQVSALSGQRDAELRLQDQLRAERHELEEQRTAYEFEREQVQQQIEALEASQPKAVVGSADLFNQAALETAGAQIPEGSTPGERPIASLRPGHKA